MNTKIKLEMINNKYYKIIEDVKIDEFIIPKGFKTDGASIPKIFWSLFGCPFVGKYVKAAILHDYLYSGNIDITFHKANLKFYKNMRKSGVSKFKAFIMFKTVEIFGKSHFLNKNKKDNK